jgi:hypothetical protein
MWMFTITKREVAVQLLPFYTHNREVIATLCDDLFDKSGKLLGIVRDLYRVGLNNQEGRPMHCRGCTQYDGCDMAKKRIVRSDQDALVLMSSNAPKEY